MRIAEERGKEFLQKERREEGRRLRQQDFLPLVAKDRHGKWRFLTVNGRSPKAFTTVEAAAAYTGHDIIPYSELTGEPEPNPEASLAAVKLAAVGVPLSHFREAEARGFAFYLWLVGWRYLSIFLSHRGVPRHARTSLRDIRQFLLLTFADTVTRPTKAIPGLATLLSSPGYVPCDTDAPHTQDGYGMFSTAAAFKGYLDSCGIRTPRLAYTLSLTYQPLTDHLANAYTHPSILLSYLACGRSETPSKWRFLTVALDEGGVCDPNGSIPARRRGPRQLKGTSTDTAYLRARIPRLPPTPPKED